MTKEIEEFSSRSQESYLRFRLIKILEIALVFLSLMLIVALLFYGARVVGNLIIDGVMSPGDFWVIGGLIFQLGGAAFSDRRYLDHNSRECGSRAPSFSSFLIWRPRKSGPTRPP